MAIDRRQLIVALAGAAAAAAGSLAARAAAGPIFVSCRTNASGAASVALFDQEGAELFATELPTRGHDVAFRPGTDDAVIFARRPGNWAIVLDHRRKAVVKSILSSPGRHFYGHGVYSHDGRLLFTTENVGASVTGCIGIYDATDGYRRAGEISSRGIGPHDIALSADGRTLIIANGGIITDAATGRENVDPDAMKPSLAFVDWRNDQDLGVLALDHGLRKLSIRHLAAADSGEVAFGCQYEGDAEDMPPLLGLADRGGRMRLLEMPEADLSAMNNYVGSVALDRSQSVVGATSPRGGRLAFWEIRSGTFLSSRSISGACGIAPVPLNADFIVSSGNAGVRLVKIADRDGAAPPVLQSWVWDNHLRIVRG